MLPYVGWQLQLFFYTPFGPGILNLDHFRPFLPSHTVVLYSELPYHCHCTPADHLALGNQWFLLSSCRSGTETFCPHQDSLGVCFCNIPTLKKKYS